MWIWASVDQRGSWRQWERPQHLLLRDFESAQGCSARVQAVCLRNIPVQLKGSISWELFWFECVFLKAESSVPAPVQGAPVAICLQNDFCDGLKIGWLFQNFYKFLDLTKLNAVTGKLKRKDGCHDQGKDEIGVSWWQSLVFLGRNNMLPVNTFLLRMNVSGNRCTDISSITVKLPWDHFQ